jgi:ATP-dependent DNA helicase RecG
LTKVETFTEIESMRSSAPKTHQQITGKTGGKPPLSVETSVQFLKGVGPSLGALLEKRGIKTVGDLLQYYPRAFEDRRVARNIASLRPNELVSLKAKIFKVGSFQLGKSKRKMYDVTLRDESGVVHCKYFRVPYKGYFERFQPQQEVRVIGKVIEYRGKIELHHPEIKEIEVEEEMSDLVIPIYPEIENMTSAKILRLIRTSFEQLAVDDPEKFPPSLLQERSLLPKWEAARLLHYPEPDQAEAYNLMKTAAHRRVIFEEFFWLELFLAAKKTGLKKENSLPIKNENRLTAKLLASLPFEMTAAQTRAFAEIKQNLEEPHPMYRLVQGDVGSGKTLVCFLAATYAAESKVQSCLMVPTEILAEQHFRNAGAILKPLGLNIGMLTGKTKASERAELFQKLQEGSIDLLIGTHALIEDEVKFANLGLVIIDEQHRFGVEQRAKLKQKGLSPHFLVMTATPIPRTLAMTVYGDLEVSLIDEMPKGRSPIQTRVIYENKRPQALQFMQEQIVKGRQAYVVYPLVEESEKIDLKDAVSEFEKLKTQFPEIPMGLMHGKMKSQDKEAIMTQFRQGELKILVSTTVIEVGVDVPNANIMLIEHSERFGLSQLHQLRGRVGRGIHKSFCIMIMGRAVSDEARARTSFMEKNIDGFKIAEFDLELRGPGEFLGTRQSGLPGFRMANLVRDIIILQEARDAAFKILEEDPQLLRPENKSLREELLRSHGPAALANIA